MALALGAILFAGCNDTTNEESIIGKAQPGPPDPNLTHIKTYGDIMSHQAKQAQKNWLEKKKSKSRTKASH